MARGAMMRLRRVQNQFKSNEGHNMQTLVDNGNWEEVATALSQQLQRTRGGDGFMADVIAANAQAAQNAHSTAETRGGAAGATRGGSVCRAFWWGFHVEVSHED